MLHGRMIYGHMLSGAMVLCRLSKVKDGSTNLKCHPRYFPWGGYGEVEINANSVKKSWVIVVSENCLVEVTPLRNWPEFVRILPFTPMQL